MAGEVMFSPGFGARTQGKVHAVITTGIRTSPETGVDCILHHDDTCHPQRLVLHRMSVSYVA